MQRIYLDANATTPLVPEVLDAMRPWLLESFGNASSVHHYGQQARAAVEKARTQAAALLHCREAEIVFTSGGTESDNMALFGLLTPGDHLITSAIEHHAVLHAAERLRDRGVEVSFLTTSAAGIIDPAEVRAALRPSTKLISVMMANNETGIIQPVEEIGRIAHEADVWFHTDAVQAAGKLKLDVDAIGCDLLSLSGHKMHAPQGTGILYIRRNTRLEPLFFGGSHERQRRAGTENVAGIVGLGRAAELAAEAIASGKLDRVAALRNRFEQGILSRVPGTAVNGDGPRVPNTSSLYFGDVEGEALVIALDMKGIAVSGGSACQSGASEPSHVLAGMGYPASRARASVRFSLSKLTTEADIDTALAVVPEAVERLRAIAPVNAGTLG
ncbi:cysteine desulfurase family protein [Silvibacterium dinghuense]|uniref:cysteine desulfurase n=1 Tax=Silvibacterium dinghuense TaxID=1560006 RepID=A0A4Q1SGK1_9BACT|nr:cysteine desulfurase family protein [Silvibacterium dinghuense]RXS96634.1 cysteine desulfurase [Silvibacterium dinghuense]GGG92417.1 cysteine desulfurase IscS [Silvibacterium dinghuense]